MVDPDFESVHGTFDEKSPAVQLELDMVKQKLEALDARVGEGVAQKVEDYDESNAKRAAKVIVSSWVLFASVIGVLLFESYCRTKLASKAIDALPKDYTVGDIEAIVSKTQSSLIDYLIVAPTGIYCLGLLALASRLATRESARVKMAEAKGNKEVLVSVRQVYREFADLLRSMVTRGD